MLGYAFVRPESEQNCSLGRINGALAPYNARFFVRINWQGETAQQSQLMPGSKGWKKQEPSVGERWVLGLRPRDSAGIAHLASVKRLTPRSRLTGIDSSAKRRFCSALRLAWGGWAANIFTR